MAHLKRSRLWNSILTVLGMLVAGTDSVWQYVKVLLWLNFLGLFAPQPLGTAGSDPWINPTATLKPNLHGLVANLHADARLEFLLVAVVFVAFCWLTQKTNNYELLFAANLVCGLLVSFHSGIVDDVVLFPVFVLVLGACDYVPARSLLAIILTPIPYFHVPGQRTLRRGSSLLASNATRDVLCGANRFVTSNSARSSEDRLVACEMPCQA